MGQGEGGEVGQGEGGGAGRGGWGGEVGGGGVTTNPVVGSKCPRGLKVHRKNLPDTVKWHMFVWCTQIFC